MKKISAFRSKGGKKFVLSSVSIIITTIVLVLTGFKNLYDYICLIVIGYHTIKLLYYSSI